ncbi:MAG: hypothetical protein M3M96_04300 [Candidatus Eremiobacteraeota bacterium]|nr:hypothetical protein [Candidatus Eremiobacteraeota bacterium]
MKAVALVLCGLALLTACNPAPRRAAGTPAPTPAPSASATGLPPLRIRGSGTLRNPVRIVAAQGNRRLYELLARSEEAHSSSAIAQATFHVARVTFYDRGGSTLNASAPTAFLDDRHQQVILDGGVHATTSGGLALQCDRLTYNRASGTIHGEGNVVVSGVQSGTQTRLTGSVFDSDVNLASMRMR